MKKLSLDEKGFVDLSKLRKKDYSRLVLRSNPFPATAIPCDEPLTTADRQAVIRRFTDVLSSLVTDRSSSVTVLLGDYGAGKSHLLKLFKVSVNKELLASDTPILAIYGKSPGKSMRDLFLYLIDDIGREFLSGLASRRIFDFLSKSDPDKYLPLGIKFNLTNVAQIPEYLQKARSLDII